MKRHSHPGTSARRVLFSRTLPVQTSTASHITWYCNPRSLPYQCGVAVCSWNARRQLRTLHPGFLGKQETIDFGAAHQSQHATLTSITHHSAIMAALSAHSLRLAATSASAARVASRTLHSCVHSRQHWGPMTMNSLGHVRTKRRFHARFTASHRPACGCAPSYNAGTRCDVWADHLRHHHSVGPEEWQGGGSG